MLAAGRIPNTDTLSLRTAGIDTDDAGYIRVNDRLETTTPGVWALGDVTGGPAFAHLSYDDSRIVTRNLFGDGKGSRDGRLVTSTLFTDPPLARVGIREIDLPDAPGSARVITIPTQRIQPARDLGETRGFLKAILDTGTGQILGFSMLGPGAAELAGAVQLAMMGNVPFTRVADGLFATPTMIEALNQLFSEPTSAQDTQV